MGQVQQLMPQLQFDSIDMSKNATKPLTGHHYLEFDNYELVNITSAVESGLVNKSDSDCAASSPNAVHSLVLDYATPSLFKSNATAALASANS